MKYPVLRQTADISIVHEPPVLHPYAAGHARPGHLEARPIRPEGSRFSVEALLERRASAPAPEPRCAANPLDLLERVPLPVMSVVVALSTAWAALGLLLNIGAALGC